MVVTSRPATVKLSEPFVLVDMAGGVALMLTVDAMICCSTALTAAPALSTPPLAANPVSAPTGATFARMMLSFARPSASGRSTA